MHGLLVVRFSPFPFQVPPFAQVPSSVTCCSCERSRHASTVSTTVQPTKTRSCTSMVVGRECSAAVVVG